MPGKTFEFLGDIYQLYVFFLGLYKGLKFLNFTDRLINTFVKWDEFSNAIDFSIRNTHNSGDISKHGPRLHSTKGYDLGYVFFAKSSFDEINNLISSGIAKIRINIR